MIEQPFAVAHGEMSLRGRLFHDGSASGPRPGVIVVHEAWGLVNHTLDRARMLAEMGYVSVAADMYGDGRQVPQIQEAVALVSSLRDNPTELRSRAEAILTGFRSLPQVDAERVAAIGYCFGGTTVLELARAGAALSGVVSFHGGLLTPEPAKPGVVRAKILVCTGHDDPYAPPEHIASFKEEMSVAQADWQLICYGLTAHSFTNPEADGSIAPPIIYNEQSDRRSWAAMQHFLHEAFV